jgi:hypothetical protein
MFKTVLATALVSAALVLGAPSAAQADERLEGMCNFAGGTMEGDVCVLPDGRTVTCPDDDGQCIVEDPPIAVRHLGKLTNVPKLILKKPVQSGPVEIAIEKGSKIKLVAPARRLTDVVETPTEKTFKRADAVSSPVEKTIKQHDAPVMKTETLSVAPALKLKSFN